MGKTRAHDRLAIALVMGCLVVASHGIPISKLSKDVHSHVPSILFHISDLHISEHVSETWYTYGNVLHDLKLLTETVIRHVAPESVLITGDLTDSKDFKGAGEQDLQEWEGYSEFLTFLVERGGINPAHVLDIRGNHDGFNAPAMRGDIGDYFNAFSSSGRHGYGSDRLVLHVLYKTQDGNPVLQTLEKWVSREGAEKHPKCPVAILFGIDASADPGLKSPANFVGMLNSSDLNAASETAKDIKWRLHAINCTSETPIISYGHFPLSTLSSVPKDFGWGAMSLVGALRHALSSLQCMQGMAKIIAEFSTVYISGHLHAAFGERLHRVHSVPESQAMLTELETAAWKDDRRFRIMGIDSGCMSFSDFYFHTSSAPVRKGRSDWKQKDNIEWLRRFQNRGWGVTAAAHRSNAMSLDHIALITWPVDPRYAFCPVERASYEKNTPGSLRATVFSLSNDSAIHTGGLSVTATIYHKKKPLLTRTMVKSHLEVVDGGIQYEADDMYFYADKPICAAELHPSLLPHKSHDCYPRNSKVWIQVYVWIESEESSLKTPSCITEPRRATLQCDEDTHKCFVVATSEKESIDNLSLTEWLTLAVNWPNVVHRVYLGLYIITTGYLFLSRAIMAKFGGQIFTYVYKRRKNRVVDYVIIWPLITCPLMTSVSRIWRIMVLYLTYILIGPLYLADVLTGAPPAVIFHQGVFGFFHGQWLAVPTPDVLLFQMMHFIFCLVPLLIWISIVMARRVVQEGRALTPEQLKGTSIMIPLKPTISIFDAAFFLFILFFNAKFVYKKAYILMGSLSVLISPGFSWSAVLCGLVSLARWNAYISPSIPLKLD